MSDIHDQDRDDFLDADLSALYRESRDAEPPLHLDSQVLSAAREAVAQHRRGRRVQYWLVPVSLMAVLVLGVGLVRLMQQEVPDMSHPLSAPASLAPEAAKRGRLDAEMKKDLDEAEAEPSPAAVPSMPLKEEASQFQERYRAPLEADAPSRPQISETLSEPELLMQDKAAVKLLKQKDQRTEAVRSPQEWLEEIAELRRQGRSAEAEASLREFRRVYPDYPLSGIKEMPKLP